MKIAELFWILLAAGIFSCAGEVQSLSVNSDTPGPNERTFIASGVIKELKSDGVTLVISHQADGSFFNHNFRTLIIDAAGHLQTVFPMGRNIVAAIVAEMLKAASVANKTALIAAERATIR